MVGTVSASMRSSLWKDAPERHERPEWKERMGSTKPEPEERNEHFDTAIITGHIKSLENPDDALREIRFVVRVFCSSTFTDTFHERTFFLEECVPYLRDSLRKRGFEFIFSEMRFGIREDASDKNLTSEICMDELKNCQENSVGAFYILLACDKYGFRPLPLKIDMAEFEEISTDMDDRDRRLVKRFYDLDRNAIKPQYVLKSKHDVDSEIISSLRFSPCLGVPFLCADMVFSCMYSGAFPDLFTDTVWPIRISEEEYQRLPSISISSDDESKDLIAQCFRKTNVHYTLNVKHFDTYYKDVVRAFRYSSFFSCRIALQLPILVSFLCFRKFLEL